MRVRLRTVITALSLASLAAFRSASAAVKSESIIVFRVRMGRFRFQDFKGSRWRAFAPTTYSSFQLHPTHPKASPSWKSSKTSNTSITSNTSK
jgi:hypothetical protein